MAHFGIDTAFDLGQLRRSHRLEMREIETQTIRRHQRALLLHVGTQHAAQRGVQQVGGAVIDDGGGTAIRIHRCG